MDSPEVRCVQDAVSEKGVQDEIKGGRARRRRSLVGSVKGLDFALQALGNHAGMVVSGGVGVRATSPGLYGENSLKRGKQGSRSWVRSYLSNPGER